jgi:hypothetical protein
VDRISIERLLIFYGRGAGLPLERRFRWAPGLRQRIGARRGLMQNQITLVPVGPTRVAAETENGRDLDPGLR